MMHLSKILIITAVLLSIAACTAKKEKSKAKPLSLWSGGESRQPLGLAVVGGLLTSQLLTLYITPVVYYLYGPAAAEGAAKEGCCEGRIRACSIVIDIY